QAVLALGIAGVGDEVDEVHGELALLAEHLLPVLQVVEVAHRGLLEIANRQYRRPNGNESSPTAVPTPTTSSSSHRSGTAARARPHPALRRIASRKPALRTSTPAAASSPIAVRGVQPRTMPSMSASRARPVSGTLAM